MILTNEEYQKRQAMSQHFRTICKRQSLKALSFIILCLLVATFATKDHSNPMVTLYFAQRQVINKNTRGVFPPLEGRVRQIRGTWKVIAEIGQTTTDESKFKNYRIKFLPDESMELSWEGQTDCDASNDILRYKWKTIDHNIFITKTPRIQTPEFNNLQSKKNPISISPPITKPCFQPEDPLATHIIHFGVWTINKRNLYLLSEQKGKEEESVTTSIFVLERVK